MNRDLGTSVHAGGLTRRRFLESAAGGAACALLSAAPGRAEADRRSDLLRDYVGRLCYNENPLGPSPAARAAMIAAIDLGHRYPDWFAESLRADLATLHGVSSSRVIAGCGATEILRLAALALAGPGVNVVCPYPSYSQFPSDCSFLGAQVRNAPLDSSHRVDPAAVLALVDANTVAVCLTNPNNPTATLLPAAEVAGLVASLPPGVPLIVDEAYNEYVHDAGYASAIALVVQGTNVLVARTFSKAPGLAGVRVGYGVGAQSLVSSLASWQTFATVSRLALDAARAALTDASHIAATVALNDEVKAYCFPALAGLGLSYIPSETNFFMVDVGQPAGPVSSALAARGILVRTGWGMPNHLRVSTGTMPEMTVFVSALGEILGLAGASGPVSSGATLLHGNFPNPVREATRITYTLAAAGEVRVSIYDIQGRQVRELRTGGQDPGHHAVEWDGRDERGERCAAGSYFYRLEAGRFEGTRRLTLID